MATHLQNRALIVEDFRRARRRAALQEIFAHLTGRSVELLSYEEVRGKLKGNELYGRKLQSILLDSIVGSVGRYRDFTRRFLPRDDSQLQRWARVKMGAAGFSGLPPIEVYQINDVYFVIDGNHRVSVAAEMGLTRIEAYVTVVKTRVPLSRDDQPDDLIIKAEYAQFLEQTQIDRLRPAANLQLTAPDRYRRLLEHIDVHHYYMGLETDRDIDYSEAVAHWYDTVYLPVSALIRERAVLLEFPERTETDLYLWISQHRAELAQSLGWEVTTQSAVYDLKTRYGNDGRAETTARPAQSRLQKVLMLDNFATEVERQTDHPLPLRREDRVVNDILVAIDGEHSGWNAMEQALIIASREMARLIGVHIIGESAHTDPRALSTITQEFTSRCAAHSVQGSLLTLSGRVNTTLCEYTRLVDLVVLSQKRAPAVRDGDRTSKSLRELMHASACPVLAVPGTPSALAHPLLAYDRSAKSGQALYIATYLANWWNVTPVVITVNENSARALSVQKHARTYLDRHKVEAIYVTQQGDADAAILKTVEQYSCDGILIGGSGKARMLRFMLGSVVDTVLSNSQIPVLVCR